MRRLWIGWILVFSPWEKLQDLSCIWGCFAEVIIEWEKKKGWIHCSCYLLFRSREVQQKNDSLKENLMIITRILKIFCTETLTTTRGLTWNPEMAQQKKIFWYLIFFLQIIFLLLCVIRWLCNIYLQQYV